MTEPTREGVELLPCPFCGSRNVDPEGWASTERSGPACDDCAGSADTIELWNSRPLTAASRASGPALGALSEAIGMAELMRAEIKLCADGEKLGRHRRIEHDTALLYLRRASEEIERLVSLARTTEASGCPVPDGWQLVPKKMTQEMADAALATQDIYTGRGALAGLGYEAALAAAPSPPHRPRPGEASGWRDIATAPESHEIDEVIVIGGRYLKPTIVPSDGEYWRANKGRLKAVPTHWQPVPSPPASPTKPRGDET